MADAEAAAAAMAMAALQAGAGVEATPEAVETAVAAAVAAQRRAEEEALKPPPVRFVVADVENLPVPDARDCVVDRSPVRIRLGDGARRVASRAPPGGVALLVELASQIGPGA